MLRRARYLSWGDNPEPAACAPSVRPGGAGPEAAAVPESRAVAARPLASSERGVRFIYSILSEGLRAGSRTSPAGT